jgi:hypothetical protein
MIEKTTQIFLRSCNVREDGREGISHAKTYNAKIKKTTWWVLFVPVFSYEEVLTAQI